MNDMELDVEDISVIGDEVGIPKELYDEIKLFLGNNL